MILIDAPYNRVNDLARGDQNGFQDPDEYNRAIAECQQTLMSYYIMRMEETQVIPENLLPFITDEEVDVVEGEVERPINYRFLLELYAGYLSVSDCQTSSVSTFARPIGSNRLGENEASPIRRSSLTNPRYYYRGDSLVLLPKGQFSKALVRYIRHPIEGILAYEENTVTKQLDYSTAGSQHLEWGEQELSNFVDLLLDMKGIATKDTALIQWASRRKLESNVRIQ